MAAWVTLSLALPAQASDALVTAVRPYGCVAPNELAPSVSVFEVNVLLACQSLDLALELLALKD